MAIAGVYLGVYLVYMAPNFLYTICIFFRSFGITKCVQVYETLKRKIGCNLLCIGGLQPNSLVLLSYVLIFKVGLCTYLIGMKISQLDSFGKQY